MNALRLLGNILWHFPFFGFITALITFLIGCLWTVTVVGAPVGLGLIQFSKFLLLPFSYDMVNKDDVHEVENTVWQKYSFIIKILYYPLGIILAILAIVQIVGLCFTLLGIPMAIALAKALPTYLNPVNKICVPHEVGAALSRYKSDLERQKAEAMINKKYNSE